MFATRTALSRVTTRRFPSTLRKTSTDAGAGDAASSSGLGALAAAVTTTFGTYCIADFLSNFLQHPTQLMDYGYFNSFLGRDVDQPFWGTRTQHIIGVAACLAVTDHASQSIFAKYMGKPICFGTTPGAFVAHTFLFIFAGVTLYVAGDAALNPTIEDNDRMQAMKEGTYASYVGSNTAWFEPFVAPAVLRVTGSAALSNSWVGSALLPATLAYTTVKGVGWNDWGNQGLNAYEMKLNGLAPETK